MARPNPFADNKTIAKVLKTFAANPDDVSYAHKQKLIERELIHVSGSTVTNKVEHAGRGRHKLVYELTGKGRNLFNLSKNWK